MKVRHQLLLVLVLTSLLTSLLIAVGSSQLLRTSVRERYVERIRSESGMLAWWIGKTAGTVQLQNAATASAARLGYRVTIVDRDGVVLADSSRTPDGVASMDNHALRPEIAEAMRTGAGESERRSATTGERYYYRGVRVDGDGPVSIVRVALPTLQIERTQVRLTRLAVGVSLAVLGLLVVVAYVVVRRLSRRIETIADVAERTAAGDMTLEVENDGTDEIGRLASSLRRMKRNMLARVRDVEDERRLLASIVSGIQEGLLLIGDDRRIRLANASLRRIFQVPVDPTGRLLAEVIRIPAVTDRLEDILAGADDVRELVVRSPDTGRSFELHTTIVIPEQGTGRRSVLALFFDITRLEALENVRQEFVANVSHELRTPLTSIRAFVENLLDGAIDDLEHRDRFLDVIRRQTEYMGTLVDDLTDLSRIETGAIELHRESVDLLEVSRGVVRRVLERFPDSGVRVETDFEGAVVGRFDRRRMDQVLFNLVENAVKFHRRGGSVTIRGRRDSSRILIEVEDDGVGIPSESVPRIFNRFYRVDPARSKEVPGTGLGLAIVKHLVRLHGGTVEVRSELGRGSTFSLEFQTETLDLA